MNIVKYIEIAMLVALVALSIATIQGVKIRRAIIYLGGFSLLSSFIYIFYNAPDVAIAEAVIGCTISVILLLTALKRHRIMTIYYVNETTNDDGLKVDNPLCTQLLTDLDGFLSSQEFEPQLVRTSLDDATLHESEDFDLLIVGMGSDINIYSGKDNYHTVLINNYLQNYNREGIIISFHPLMEEVSYED